MVSIKQASESAAAFARDTLGPERTEGIRLEEVESGSVDGEDAWIITLSMINPDPVPSNAFASAFGADIANRRQYKSFTVTKRGGEIKSMKIRALAGA